MQPVRFNIRNRWQNISNFLKISAKDRRIFNKMSEVKNLNFSCCTTFLRLLQTLTHIFYLTFGTPVTFSYKRRALVFMTQSCGTASCWEREAPSKRQQLLQSVAQAEWSSRVRMQCQLCITWPWGVNVKHQLHRFCRCKEPPGSWSSLFCTQPLTGDVTESWGCLGHHLFSHIPLQSKFSSRHLHS